MPVTVKNGLMALNTLFTPDSVKPGETFVVRGEVNNQAATIIPSTEEDVCGLSAGPCTRPSIGNGYCTEVVFQPDWTNDRVDGPHCVEDLIGGNNNVTFEKVLTAPQSGGDYEVQAYINLPQSNTQSASLSQTITVSSDAPEEPEYPEDGNGGNGDDDGGSGPTDNINSVIRNGALLVGAIAAVRAIGLVEGD